MKLIIVGITGKVGSRIGAEALSRGHGVTGISRSLPPEASPANGVHRIAADVHDTQALTAAFTGHDVVVHAYRPSLQDPDRVGQQCLATLSMLQACREAGVPRLMAVGGAGSLRLDGVPFMEHPSFPPEWKVGGVTTYLVKRLLELQADLDWTFVCPPHMITPGVRTGRYRTSLDDLLFDDTGRSWISIEDYAVAFVDELETPRHSRRRFAVAT